MNASIQRGCGKHGLHGRSTREERTQAFAKGRRILLGKDPTVLAKAPASNARFRVAITCYAATPTRPDERWGIDNVVKPTIDAMEGIFGLRAWRGVARPQDDRLDKLAATKGRSLIASRPGADRGVDPS